MKAASIIFILSILFVSGCNMLPSSSGNNDSGAINPTSGNSPYSAAPRDSIDRLTLRDGSLPTEAEVLGTDDDGDGLRDDMKAVIEKEANGDEELEAWMEDSAKRMNIMLLAGLTGDRDASIEIAHIDDVPDACVRRHRPKRENYGYSVFIEKKMINTKARAIAYLRYNAMLGGESFGFNDDDNLVCDGFGE